MGLDVDSLVTPPRTNDSSMHRSAPCYHTRSLLVQSSLKELSYWKHLAGKWPTVASNHCVDLGALGSILIVHGDTPTPPDRHTCVSAGDFFSDETQGRPSRPLWCCPFCCGYKISETHSLECLWFHVLFSVPSILCTPASCDEFIPSGQKRQPMAIRV